MTHRGLSQRGAFSFPAVSLVLVLLGMFARAAAEPGQAPTSPPSLAFTRQEDTENTSLSEFFAATGKLFLSVDGVGSNDVSHTAEVEKPNATATVRQAFVVAVSSGFSRRVLANGDVTINGTGINWDRQVPSSISSNNHLADVTSIVKPIVDAAAPGRIPFTFTEVDTFGIDGEVLVVIFDDPTQTGDQTIVLLFGAQDIAGDTFAITLANPIDPAAPGALVDMGLGISFSAQPGQVSFVDVNGTRVTSSAGGEDDGRFNNGELITVGGLTTLMPIHLIRLRPPVTHALMMSYTRCYRSSMLLTPSSLFSLRTSLMTTTSSTVFSSDSQESTVMCHNRL